MVDGRAEPVERGEMLGHAVAHVALEPVTGIFGTEPHHEAVACHLGDDRGGCDRGNQIVAVDDRLTIAIDIDVVAAVDQDELRLDWQWGDGLRQHPERSAQDVVDAARFDLRDRYLRMRADAIVQHCAPFRRELFGIVESTRHKVRVENDRRGDDRSGERTATGVIATGNRPNTALECRALAERVGRFGGVGVI